MEQPRKRVFKVFKGLLGILIFFLTAIVAVTFIFAGEIYLYRDTVKPGRLPDVDAIVCLAGGRGRIGAAGDLWFRYWDKEKNRSRLEEDSEPKKIPVLYFSGISPQVSWSILSKQLSSRVLPVLQKNDVILEKESINTDANARWLVRYAQENNWKRILLMTSTYHMKRASFIFDSILKKAENPVGIETLSVYQEPFDQKSWRTDLNGIRVTFVEYIKWIYYRWIW
jgi:uncharacterized SAM-binding protein YcdF (DUF218 family)